MIHLVYISMRIPLRQEALFLTPAMHHSLMPHWLTHLGALGLFSVAVVDSSFIPLPLPGSTDLSVLRLVAYGGDPWLLAAFAIAGSLVADTRRGTSGVEVAKRHCDAASGSSSWASYQMGGASPHTRRVSSRRASTAGSTIAVCACRWRARRRAQPLPGRLRLG